ncbi:T9SS type A sorting domain-containing protein [Ferruginibacter yonginensis]|uniref:T9SS type A sorting domain-containing protein n=1 Tax=Ferruginibacter yonginensis TaxID=1310416 RepID=A0ABV8QWM9_9BACT
MPTPLLKKTTLFIAFIVTTFCLNTLQAQPPGTNWVVRNIPVSTRLTSVTFGNGVFVAISSNTAAANQVFTSPDGITWTARNAAENNGWLSVTFGNGIFVAVATNGTNQVMTSPDGITWTARTAASNALWCNVTFGNSLFVAVSQDGQVMTSPNGINWTARTPAAANIWFGITFGNNTFVAVSVNGTNRVMTSPDGITWTARTAAENNVWSDVTFGNGLFVAVSGDGTNQVMTSPDGITWTARTAAESNNWRSVTFGNGLFVAVANSLTTNNIMTSPDGINWTLRVPVNGVWFDVTYNNFLFVAVANSTTGAIVMTSGTFGVLPLKFTNFTVQNNQNNALLTWSTTNEINTQRFEVQRSTNGSNFTSIGTLPTQNTSGNHQYQFTDAAFSTLTGTKVFYRIQLVDVDGAVQYSSTQALPLSNKKINVVVSPNPVTTQAQVQISSSVAENVNITIINTAGKVCYQQNKRITIGNNNIAIPVQPFSTGIYTLSIKGNTINETTQFIK